MDVLPYDFNGLQLARAGLDPQLSHCGMIEFHLEDLIAEAKEPLMLGLKSFNMPDSRSMGTASIAYLNGVVKYPTKVNALNNLSCVFQDYINGRQRELLHLWFDLVFDENTGLGNLASAIKINADMLLFAQDGIERAKYLLVGLFPTKDPGLPDISYESSSLVTITMEFSMDFYLDVSIGSRNPNSRSITIPGAG